MWCVQEPGCPCDDWAFVLNASNLKVLHYWIAMAHTTTGSIYLSNNLRLALGLNSVEPAHRALKKAEAYAARTGKVVYIPGLGEIGGTPPQPIPPLGITAAVTKQPSVTPDDTGVITISGSKASHGAMLDYVFKMDGRVQTPKHVEITTGMTAIQVATAVVDQFTDPDVTVKRTGGALEFAPESGSFLAKLTVAIS